MTFSVGQNAGDATGDGRPNGREWSKRAVHLPPKRSQIYPKTILMQEHHGQPWKRPLSQLMQQ